MTDQPTSPPEDGVGDVAVQERRRRFLIVWIIPIVVVLVGGWLPYRTIAEKGPTITIGFKTAETLEAGKPPSQATTSRGSRTRSSPSVPLQSLSHRGYIEPDYGG
jgi:hypothetical protein